MVTCRAPGGLAFASGPPVYIFDDAGTLVHWTPDNGDDPAFTGKWGWPIDATPLSPDEIERLKTTSHK